MQRIANLLAIQDGQVLLLQKQRPRVVFRVFRQTFKNVLSGQERNLHYNMVGRQ